MPGFGPASAPVAACGVLGFLEALGSYNLDFSPISSRTPRVPSRIHARGDNLFREFSRRPDRGSPPRAWGQLTRPVSLRVAVRFTPTRVGTTRQRIWFAVHSAVHPHPRGDNKQVYDGKQAASGSPPRAWGQRVSESGSRFTARFTPHARGDNTLRASANA